PFSYRPLLSVDARKNRWIYVASGRLAPGDTHRQQSTNAIVGLKEKRLPNGEFVMDAATPFAGSVYQLNELLDVSAVRVNQENGSLSGALNISPVLERSHVLELEQRLMEYSDAGRYQPGWYRSLDPREVATA